MIAMVLQELEPERIEKDQGDALVTFDPASDLGATVKASPLPRSRSASSGGSIDGC
jgi:hypothetical protein